MAAPEDPVAALADDLARHPEERYPVQHATTRYHLGVALTNLGRLAEGEEALRAAARIFAGRLPVEHAKAANALGANLRLAGRLSEAVAALEEAVAGFAKADAGVEHGAALFNLGLAQRDLDRLDDSAACFRLARELLEAGRTGPWAAAAARELGTTLLSAGEPEAAAAVLEEACALAEEARDQAEIGGAANTLGLALLGVERPHEAAVAFRRAAAAHPRRVRPAEHAMAKANLSLALERSGEAARARLAARQALGVPEAPELVSAQAAAVLARLGEANDDLAVVLADEPEESRVAVLRDELARWIDASPDGRRVGAREWLDLQRGEPELATAWVGALLELPPDALDAVVGSTLEALAERSGDELVRFRDDVRRAAAGFHAPQQARLEETFDRIAGEVGLPRWK